MRKATIIDLETGQITGEINEGDKILRKNSIKKLETTEIWKIEKFYKGNATEIKLLMKELDVYEKALLFSIATYINYEDCCIKFDNGVPMGTEDIITVSGLARRTGYSTIKDLILKHVLYKGDDSKEKHYFVNPWLFCKGNRINKVLKTMFRNYKIRVLNKRWKDIK